MYHDILGWKQVHRNLLAAIKDSNCTVLFDFDALTVRSSHSDVQKTLRNSAGLSNIIAACVWGVPPSEFSTRLLPEENWSKHYTTA